QGYYAGHKQNRDREDSAYGQDHEHRAIQEPCPCFNRTFDNLLTVLVHGYLLCHATAEREPKFRIKVLKRLWHEIQEIQCKTLSLDLKPALRVNWPSSAKQKIRAKRSSNSKLASAECRRHSNYFASRATMRPFCSSTASPSFRASLIAS